MGLVEVRLIGSKKDVETMVYGLDKSIDMVSKTMIDHDDPEKFRVYIVHYEP